jgi:hypothetical protein
MGRRAQRSLTSGTHFQRITLAIILALFALYCDLGAPHEQRAAIQAGILTVGLFTYFFLELRRLLKRPRLLALGVCLIPVHLYFLRTLWRKLPFDSSLIVVFIMLVEVILLTFVFLRLGQEIDPDGPLGWTDEERRTRGMSPRIDI